MLLVIVVQKALKLELQALARGGQEGGSSPVLLPAGFWLPPALPPAPFMGRAQNPEPGLEIITVLYRLKKAVCGDQRFSFSRHTSQKGTRCY